MAKSLALEPMYASIGKEMPAGPGWTFEPKYDGMRVLAYVDGVDVRLVTRNGKDKTVQFPEIADALRSFGRKARRTMILDGEVVALTDGRPARFQALQGRMHVRDAGRIETLTAETPAALVLFDALLLGKDPLTRQPWTSRRSKLERVFAHSSDSRLLISETSGDGAAMIARARDDGWEGVIAKRTDATYTPGARSRAWLKLKVEHTAEFVIGGYTEPRGSRAGFGAILLGYYDDRGALVYAGHTGTGFTRDTLDDLHRRLSRIEQAKCPFSVPPKTNQPAQWVKPRLVAEIKFAEWTTAGILRQPVFLGLRDDKAARDVRREEVSIQARPRRQRLVPRGAESG